jgi:FkbM family methyltransferase
MADELFHFEEILTPPRIRAVDVGAMLISDRIDPLVRLTQAGLAELVGFEPQPVECDRLNGLRLPNRRYLPYALGDGSVRTLYVTNTAMTTSLLRPNVKLVSLFHSLGELMQVVATPQITTLRFDDVPELHGLGCDYLKLDTQGSELEILTHATETLRGCLLIETEVSFVPLYEGSPLFADVDRLLRARGFTFLRFLGMSGRPYRPLVRNGDPNQLISQMLWTDAVYVRDVERLHELGEDQLAKLAALLHEIYGAVDLAHLVLTSYDGRRGTTHAARYLDCLTRTAAPPTGRAAT